MPRPLSRYLQDNGTFVLCGWCYTPLASNAAQSCDTCTRELYDCSEYAPSEWRALDRAPCPRCGVPGVADARACARCRKLKAVDEEYLDDDGNYVSCCLCETRVTPDVEVARIAALGSDASPSCMGCGFELWDVYGRPPDEWHKLARTPCPLCGAESYADRRVCAACRRWKHPEDDEQRAHNARVTPSAR